MAHLFAALLVLLAAPAPRNSRGAAQLEEAKQAYQFALSKTGDFDCVAPAFDEVLKLLDAVPVFSKEKAEAKGLARTIREKRAAALAHAAEVEKSARAAAAATPRAAAPAPAAEAAPAPGAPAPAVDKQACKAATRRMARLRLERQRKGLPDLNAAAPRPDGEVAYLPGAAATPEELRLLRQLRACRGEPAGEE